MTRTVLALCCLFGLMQLPIAGADAQKTTAADSKAREAEKAAFERVCGACHSTAMINSFRSEPDWRETVDNMIQNGANGTNEDFDRVMRYLARNWTKIDINSANTAQIAAALGTTEETGAAVVKYRSAHGQFASIADLKKVPRVAQVDLESRKERIVFSNQSEKEK